jgi:hypothetical protein
MAPEIHMLQHLPGGRRQPGRRLDKGRGARRIGALPDVLTDIAPAPGQVVIGVADPHVPIDRVRHVILGQVEERIPWAPLIGAVTHGADHRVGRAPILRVGATWGQSHAGHRDATGQQRPGNDVFQGARGPLVCRRVLARFLRPLLLAGI